MIQNIVIGDPLVDAWQLLASDMEDWENNESGQTLFTKEHNLARALKEAGVVPSVSEVRRNRPELFRTLNEIDCFWVKWGKHHVYVVVGM